MKKLLTLLVFLAFVGLATLPALAQKVTHTFRDVSISDALRQLNEQSTDYAIIFLYNELENFRVTTSFRDKPLPDAIRQMIGFYPIRMTVATDDDPDVQGKPRHRIFVECTHKADRHLTGTIIDEQGRPVVYANIAVLNPADSTLLSGGVSNESGYFAVPYDAPPSVGEAVLARISCVGFTTVYQLSDKPVLGTVRMHSATQRLEDITVEGQTPVLRREPGAIILDTRHIAGAINAGDLLPYAPGIIIDDEDISLLGASGIILCINGKEQKVQARDMLRLLQSYPAADVERIEVIQNPDASYSAEGHAGIINIVLSKHDNDFIGGSVAYARTQYEKHGDEATASIVYNKGIISTSLNLAASKEQTIDRKNSTVNFSDTQRFSTADGFTGRKSYTLRWQLDCQASRLLSLGAYVMLADGERQIDTDRLYNYLPLKPYSHNSMTTQTSQGEDTKTWALNINAIQKLGDSGPRISCNLDHYRMRMDDGRHSVCYETFVGSSPDIIRLSDTLTYNYINTIAQTVDNNSAKLDVSYAGLSLGSQYIHNRSHLDLDNSGTGEAYAHVTSHYTEQILAAYAAYSGTFGSAWTLSLGARYEHTWTKGRNRPMAFDYNNDYGKLFPHLHLSCQPNDSHTFSLSYSSRIIRPNMISINPIRVWKDANNVSSGNQRLKPTYLHKAMMSYAYKGALGIDLYYTFQPDRIDVFYQVDEYRIYSSWDNITDEHRLGINAFCCYDKTRWLTATLMHRIWYSRTDRLPREIVPGRLHRSLYSRVEDVSVSETLQASVFFDRERKWTATIDATFISPEKDVTRKLDARYKVDIGAQYRFWKNRLTLGLSCRNLFASHVKGTEYIGTKMMAFDNKLNYRMILLSLTCQWGARLRHQQHHYESDEIQQRMVNDF